MVVWTSSFACFLAGQAIAGVHFDTSVLERRKHALIETHPLYGRAISRDELPALTLLIKASQKLPVSAEMRLAFLMQGEGDIQDAEHAMWSSESDVFALTFRSERHDAIFFPGSSVNEGRNLLLAAACIEEFRQGHRYRYYVFIDGDVVVLPSWAEALPAFKEFLSEWEPAVGLPRVLGLNDVTLQSETDAHTPTAVYDFDHILWAVHAEAAPALLPFDNTSSDQQCVWLSPWKISILASVLFKNHVLISPSMLVGNAEHAVYPKSDCQLLKTSMALRLRSTAPRKLQDCFVDPMNQGVLVLSEELAETHLEVTNHFANLPWGSACLKRASIFNQSYGMLEDQLPDCDEQELVSKLLHRRLSDTWCQNCSLPQALSSIQALILKDPYSLLRWNELGVWIKWGGDWTLAATCFAIAQRLQHLRGLAPNPFIDENVNQLDMIMSSAGLASLVWVGSFFHLL